MANMEYSQLDAQFLVALSTDECGYDSADNCFYYMARSDFSDEFIKNSYASKSIIYLKSTKTGSIVKFQYCGLFPQNKYNPMNVSYLYTLTEEYKHLNNIKFILVFAN